MTLSRVEREEIQRLTASLLDNRIAVIPIDVESLAESLGIKVRRQVLEDEVSGLLIIRGRNVQIGVNAGHHRNRQRFTIAHELGHYMMHRDDAKFFIDAAPIFYRSHDGVMASRSQEVQANAFAAELLMPERDIRSYMNRKPIDVYDELATRQMADHFEVSTQALLIRLSELDLVVYASHS